MSIPKEPRQMMINMMYLVLTALLALNISAEILNAFYSVNDNVSRQGKAMTEKNVITYDQLDFAKKNSPEKAQAFWDAGQKLQKMRNNFIAYVDGLKKMLVDKVGGDVKKMCDTCDSKLVIDESGARNLEAATNLFVNKGKGTDLMNAINKYNDSLMALIQTPNLKASSDDVAHFKANLPLRADNTKDKEGRDWAERNFEMVPSIAALIVLNSVEADMKNSESTIANWLVSKIGSTDFKFDHLQGSIVPKKPFITVGEKFQADIFVSASSSSVSPKVYIGSLDPSLAPKDKDGNLPAELTVNPVKNPGTPFDATNGIYTYKDQGSEGPHTVEGAIAVKNESTGDTKYYPFTTEYTASKPMAVVSADAMNVLYIGVDNPMTVSAPGFSNDDVTAHIDQGNITGSKGKYTVTGLTTPTAADAFCNISVSAKKSDGTAINVGKVPFRVKRVPDPIAKLGKGPYEKGGKVQAGTFKAQTGIRAELENFVFQLNFNIVSYTVTYVAKRQDPISADNTGPVYNSKISDFVQKAKPGDAFYFDNIKARGPDGLPRSLPSIVFQLI